MDNIVKLIGERVKHTRVEQGLSLRELARTAGVSASTIQKIETGSLSPSVEVFAKISKALNRRFGYLLGDQEEAETELRIIARGKGRTVPNLSQVKLESVAQMLREPRMEAFLITAPTGASSGKQVGYTGELLYHGKRGTFEFKVRGDTLLLHKGDTLHLKAYIPHQWQNGNASIAEMLVVWTPS